MPEITVVGQTYTLRQVIEMLAPALAAFAAGFITFHDFRADTNQQLALLQRAQTVIETRIKEQEQTNRRERANHAGLPGHPGVMDKANETSVHIERVDERTKNIQEDLKDVKGLLNELIRQERINR